MKVKTFQHSDSWWFNCSITICYDNHDYSNLPGSPNPKWGWPISHGWQWLQGPTWVDEAAADSWLSWSLGCPNAKKKHIKRKKCTCATMSSFLLTLSWTVWLVQALQYCRESIGTWVGRLSYIHIYSVNRWKAMAMTPLPALIVHLQGRGLWWWCWKWQWQQSCSWWR